MMFKHSARFSGMHIRILSILDDIDDIYLGVTGKEPIITSANDGQHMTKSLHYVGRAIDLRTRNLSLSEQRVVLRELKLRLGNAFDIILEPDHIHLEFDPK